MFTWLISAGAFGALAGWGWSQMHAPKSHAPADSCTAGKVEEHDRFASKINALEIEAALLRQRGIELELLNQTHSSQAAHQIAKLEKALIAAKDATESVELERARLESNWQTARALMANVQSESQRVALAQLNVMTTLAKMRQENRVQAYLERSELQPTNTTERTAKDAVALGDQPHEFESMTG